MNINKVLLFGNLTRDPEVRSLPSGAQVASMGIATNRTWKDKEGKKQEAVEYHNIVAFGRLAEIIAQYARKGSSLFVEGRMQTRSWDDKNSGEKKYRTEVIVENFQFGPKRGTASPTKDEPAPAAESQEETIEYPVEDIKTDDIPF
ncbi:MAG TPA: single-stranded DNA-binding protein [Candidatus Paceibacterota bacterium]